MSAISLTMAQNAIIINLLETTDDSDDEQLVQTIISDAKVSREIADAYLRSYRFNHSSGAIGAIRSAVYATAPIIAAERKTGAKLYVEESKQALKPLVPGEKGDPSLGAGKIAAIIQLHKAGHSNAEIVGMGYNKSTVGRQVGEYKKRVAAAKALQNEEK